MNALYGSCTALSLDFLTSASVVLATASFETFFTPPSDVFSRFRIPAALPFGSSLIPVVAHASQSGHLLGMLLNAVVRLLMWAVTVDRCVDVPESSSRTFGQFGETFSAILANARDAHIPNGAPMDNSNKQGYRQSSIIRGWVCTVCLLDGPRRPSRSLKAGWEFSRVCSE